MMKLPKELTTVTPLSKTVALLLFISMPIIGFGLGMRYQEGLDSQIPMIADVPLNGGDKIIMISLIFNVIITLLLIFSSTGNKKIVKRTLGGAGGGLLLAFGALILGMGATLVASLVINYPLEPVLVIIVALVPFIVSMGAFVGRRMK